MKVPLFSPREQNAALADELKQRFGNVLDSGTFILGNEVEAFEHEVADYLHVNHAVGVSSGTDALLIALMAAGIGSGDEVVVPSFTFFATAGAVQRLGARPVFADVCPACYQMMPDEVERSISERTRAIIPVHLFGQAAPANDIVSLAQKRGIQVIEDVAQAMGAKIGSLYAGVWGNFGCFSFFPTKNLGGFGDGGAVTTNDAQLADQLRRLRNHGMHPKYYHSAVGGNFRLDAIQAALLRVKLPQLDDYLSLRKGHADRYRRRLGEHSQIVTDGIACGSCSCRKARSAEGIISLPVVRDGQEPTWNQFTIRVHQGRRDALKQYLSDQGVASEIYYPVPLHMQECFRGDQEALSLPHTEQLCSEVLSLPVYPELKEAQIDFVIDTILAWVDAQKG